MGSAGSSAFFNGAFCIDLFKRFICGSNRINGRAFDDMSILIAVVGASIWCIIVYLILKFFGFCTRDDDE